MRAVLVAALVAAFALSARAEEKGDLAGKMKEAKVSLEKGIAASKTKGKPISAKYEVEDGKLQLSVYTAKGDSFSEVIVNHKTGKRGEGGAHHRRRRSDRGQGAERGDEQSQDSATDRGLQGCEGEQGVQSGERGAVTEGRSPHCRRDAVEGFRVEDRTRAARLTIASISSWSSSPSEPPSPPWRAVRQDRCPSSGGTGSAAAHPTCASGSRRC